MGYKFIFSKNKGKNNATGLRPPGSATVERFDSEVRQSRCQSSAKLI